MKTFKKREINIEDFTSEKVKEAGEFLGNAGKITLEKAKEKGKVANEKLTQSAKLASEFGYTLNKGATKVVKNASTTTNKVGNNVVKLDMFNSKLRKQAIENFNIAVERYESVAEKLELETQNLYECRKKSIIIVREVEKHINKIANTPKEFKINLKKIEIEIDTFESKEIEIKRAESEARVAAGGAGGGATISALGIAVATMGPTAAMGVATTFGVASTGTAISTLSGAAATNAALAWLGGGALAAGGGGMSAGSALLVLAGPVGWTIAGVAGAAAIGSGLFAKHKNKETVDKLLGERQNLETIIRKFNNMVAEVEALTETTEIQVSGLKKSNNAMAGTDYSLFTYEEKQQAGLLINSTLTLAQLINKEIKINE